MKNHPKGSNRTYREPSMILNKIYYTTSITNPDMTKYGETPETKMHYHRVRKRFYLKDVVDFEEYKENYFENFSNSPLTLIDTAHDNFVAEIDFDAFAKIMNQFDQNRILNILN